MADEFNSMLDEIGVLTDRLLAANARAYDAELLTQESELSMLQSQINPHFLYNTLETIAGMAQADGSENIVRMTRAMSRIFKYAVKAEGTVRLDDELGMLDSYLRIQQLRFGDRFRVSRDVAENARWVAVPKMTLQPIVENAIVHGLESRRRGGVIEISAAVDHTSLRITVRDNGTGIEAARLAEVNETIRESRPHTAANRHRPVGLANVSHRLGILYGDRASLRITSEYGAFTEVALVIPTPEERRA
jgi:two-component system sensor histidine kinase YesM